MTENSIRISIQKIAEQNNLEISNFSALAGGDINEVFLLECSNNAPVVLKLNDEKKFPGMFQAEKAGLETLKNTGCIAVPKVIATGKIESKSYLLIEYIKSGDKSRNFWQNLGTKLAKLHSCSSKDFGFKEDNYIGSLPQFNKSCTTSSEFYITQRLEPQLKMAKNNGYELDVGNALFKNISENIPKEPPSLIHGDLWNGNYLVDEQGEAYLIDPAVAYAPREMDLGMMKLFGGFDDSLFEAYNLEYPLQVGFEERVTIWQLYYLLVHLNIFGAGYKNSVKKIIAHFS